MGLTSDHSQPFSELASTTSLSPSVIGLNGRSYLIDTSEETDYRRESVDVLQQRNTADNRDLLLLPQDVWRHQVHAWSKGAGQSNMDREDSFTDRFEDSFGIDPWTPWQVSLLPSTALLTGSPTASATTLLATHNGSLVAACGSKLYWWSDESTVVEQTPSASNDIIDITYDGDAIITLHTDGKVYKSTANNATTLFGTFASASFIAYVKDYLIVGVDNVLKNITSGTASTIYTSPVSGFRWKGACEGLTNIYLIGGAGDKSVVHRVGIKDDGTGLDPCVVAASLPDGEVGYSIGGYLGYVFIGTNKGVRMGILSSSLYTTTGNLTLGALIPTSQPVYGFEGQDHFVWYTNSQIVSTYTPTEEETLFPATNCCGLGRMDLTTFTVTDATPAYANDLVALAQTGKVVRSVVTWNDKRVFAINGAGVFMQQDELMEAGWLSSGTISFSVEDLKTGLYLQGKWLPLDGTASLDLSYDSSAFDRIADFTIQDSIRSTNMSISGARFSRVNCRLVLRRSEADATLGPVFTRWEIRAIPVKGEASRWTLPIMNYEQVEISGAPGSRDCLAELDTLMALYEDGNVFSLQESGRSYQVHAKKFVWKPEKLSGNGRSWQGIFTLIVEEIK